MVEIFSFLKEIQKGFDDGSRGRLLEIGSVLALDRSY